MKTKYSIDRNSYRRMTTEELRESFLVESLFEENKIDFIYCETERAVVGSAVPISSVLELNAGKELASDYFCERREAGILNIGGEGKVTVDGGWMGR